MFADQVAAGEGCLTRVMLESFLRGGRQEPGDPATLTCGQSVTDACMGFGTTAAVVETLATAVRQQRRAVSPVATARRPALCASQPKYYW